MQKNSFVSDGLHRIGKKLTDTRRNLVKNSFGPEEEQEEGPAAEEKNAPELPKYQSNTFSEAVAGRREEFRKTRRDMISRFTESLTVFPEEIDTLNKYVVELRNAQKTIQELLDKVKLLDDSKWHETDYSKELADAMQVVENSRLEYLRTKAKIEHLEAKNGSENVAQVSIVPELMSLSFWQIFGSGFAFFLPVIIAIFLAAIIIAMAFIFALSA